MYKVNQSPAREEFITAWLSAAKHLQKQGGETIKWLRTDLNPPLAEHLSFFIGNQLIFVFVGVEDVSGPSPRSLFLEVAEEANAIPAILPMKHNGTDYQPTLNGWGLLHAQNRRIIDPAKLESDKQIEMSDWEVHDFAIQVIVNILQEEGNKIISKQPYLRVDPSIWFFDGKENAYVIVRSGRYPLQEAPRPKNIEEIIQSCEPGSKTGYFASVSVANYDQQNTNDLIPLYRGEGMMVRFAGIEPLFDA